jgi:alpha-mannosidase
VVVCTALKHAEHGDAVIVRLWNPTGDARRCRVELPVWGIAADVHLQPFALSTLRVDPQRRRIGEVDLLERG